MYPRTVKVRSSSGTIHEYVRVVEAYRQDGKVKQRVIADLGRKDLLVKILLKLRRLLTGEAAAGQGRRSHRTSQIGVAADWGPVLRRPRRLVRPIGPSGRSSTKNSAGPKAFRSPTALFVLVANRLIAPASEHIRAGWLETHFVRDHLQGRPSSPLAPTRRLLLVQFVTNNFVEPRLTARAVDLSPLVVLIALAFWGLCWGAVGMVLAVPLTVMLKIVWENVALTRPLARLMAEA